MTREEAIEKLEAFAPMVVDDTREALGMAIEALQAEPVKHGEWEVIKRGQTGYSASDFKCSVCGTPNRCYSLTNHCAHCGAKMDGRITKKCGNTQKK